MKTKSENHIGLMMPQMLRDIARARPIVLGMMFDRVSASIKFASECNREVAYA